MSEFVRKNITIRKEQEEWIDEMGLNLSKFVQKRIDEVWERSSYE